MRFHVVQSDFAVACEDTARVFPSKSASAVERRAGSPAILKASSIEPRFLSVRMKGASLRFAINDCCCTISEDVRLGERDLVDEHDDGSTARDGSGIPNADKGKAGIPECLYVFGGMAHGLPPKSNSR